jgi:hypothetical protein
LNPEVVPGPDTGIGQRGGQREHLPSLVLTTAPATGRGRDPAPARGAVRRGPARGLVGLREDPTDEVIRRVAMQMNEHRSRPSDSGNRFGPPAVEPAAQVAVHALALVAARVSSSVYLGAMRMGR